MIRVRLHEQFPKLDKYALTAIVSYLQGRVWYEQDLTYPCLYGAAKSVLRHTRTDYEQVLATEQAQYYGSARKDIQEIANSSLKVRFGIMNQDYEIVTLIDGRRGYFYTSRFAGNYLFQPVDSDNSPEGPPEMVFDEHEVTESL